MRAAAVVLSGLLASVISVATAQNASPGSPPAAPVAGVIEKWDGTMLTVKTDASGVVSFAVPADAPVMTRKPGKLTDVTPNTFLGTTTVPRNGRLESIEVHIFPESMRGAGEGHYPWQGEPGSMMTNGNVTTVTSGNVASIASGGIMKVEYKDGDGRRGEQEIFVPQNVPVTVIEQVGVGALKPGVRVTGQVRQNPDGSAAATRLNVTP